MTQPQMQMDMHQLVPGDGGPDEARFLLASMMGLGLEKEQALLEANSCTDAPAPAAHLPVA